MAITVYISDGELRSLKENGICAVVAFPNALSVDPAIGEKWYGESPQGKLLLKLIGHQNRDNGEVVLIFCPAVA